MNLQTINLPTPYLNYLPNTTKQLTWAVWSATPSPSVGLIANALATQEVMESGTEEEMDTEPSSLRSMQMDFMSKTRPHQTPSLK